MTLAGRGYHGRLSAHLEARLDDRICRISTDGTREFHASERSHGLATDHKVRVWFLHGGTIAQGWPSAIATSPTGPHALMTAAGTGRLHRATSPANPLVTMVSPSMRIPTRWDRCARNIQSGRAVAASQNLNKPSASPAITNAPSGLRVA